MGQETKGKPTLNVCYGDDTHDDMINVSQRNFPGINIVALPYHLPFRPKSFERVFCSDVLQHVSHRLYMKALDILCSLTTRHLYLKTIALDRVLDRWLHHEISDDDLNSLLYGNQDRHQWADDCDWNYASFTASSIRQRIIDNGFMIEEFGYDNIGNLNIVGRRIGKREEYIEPLDTKPGPKNKQEAAILMAKKYPMSIWK